jgi:shikimate dehydrogenase
MAELTIRAFVCGRPIAHSRSPMIHGHWLKEYGVNGSYDRIEVAPVDFPAFMASLQTNGFAGGNVTIPNKELAFAAVDLRDDEAEAVGAVNTLWFEGEKLVGGNTDAIGFAANLDAFAPQWRERGHALIVGAGGASRAVVHAILQAGFDRVDIVNRTASRGQDLADRFGRRVVAHGLHALSELTPLAGLVVNTTSLGMGGDGAVPLDVGLLPDDAVVTDTVYAPLMTPLLTAAAGRGLVTVDGLGMLLHQAAPGFARWFGVMPAVTDELRNRVIADLEKR